jgi:hypothetical protein
LSRRVQWYRHDGIGGVEDVSGVGQHQRRQRSSHGSPTIELQPMNGRAEGTLVRARGATTREPKRTPTAARTVQPRAVDGAPRGQRLPARGAERLDKRVDGRPAAGADRPSKRCVEWFVTRQTRRRKENGEERIRERPDPVEDDYSGTVSALPQRRSRP